MAKMPLDHLRSRKKQVYLDVPIPDDGQYLTARDEARNEFMRLDLQSKMGRTGKDLPENVAAEIEEAKERLHEAEEALKPHLIWFRATSLPPKQYDKHVSEHPPTDEQRKQAKKDGITALAYNHETFLLELVVRCVTYAYTEDDDGEIANAYPDPKTGKLRDDVKFEPITQEYLNEMQEEGSWAQGEIMVLCEAAANVNQNIRRVGTLGNG
jgi:hypothetical protein